VNSVAAGRSARPLYQVFLELVIRIDAVQRHRPKATDEYASGFFDAGRLLGELEDYRWALDEPELLSRRGVYFLGVIDARGFTPFKEKEISPAMQTAWDAAVAAWKEFVRALGNGEYIATATHPATGKRHELDPAEWLRTGLVLDVRNGDLIEGSYDRPGDERTVRWSAIVVEAAIQQRKLGAIDWDAEWSEDVARRQQGRLPNKKAYTRELEARIKERYGVTSVDGGDLRRFKAALYRDDLVRPRKK
jgi:hypothetical protein